MVKHPEGSPFPSSTKSSALDKNSPEYWNNLLKAEGMDTEPGIDNGKRALLEQMHIGKETLQEMRTQILSYLVQREDTFGAHEKQVRQLLADFKLDEGLKAVVEDMFRNEEAALLDIEKSVNAVRRLPEKQAMMRLMAQYPDIHPDMFGILWDRFGSQLAAK